MSLTRASALAALVLAAPLAIADAGSDLHALFDSEWERGLRESPVSASYLGDRRYNDLWPDLSLKAFDASHAADEAALTRLKAIDRAALSPADQLNRDLFERDLQDRLDGYRFRAFLVPLDHSSGIQTTSELADVLRFQTAKDYADWIARMEKFGGYMDQTIALMRLGVKEKRTAPKVILRRAADQIRAQLTDDPTKSPFYAPFLAMPDAIPQPEQAALKARAQKAIKDVVVPQHKRY